METPNVKECHYCHEIKTFDHFNKSSHCKYGITNKCKECRKKYSIENRERERERKKQWHLENKEKQNQRSLEYYYKNKEHLYKKSKEWIEKHPDFKKKNYQKNKEKHKVWRKKWRDKNKEYFKEYNRNYRKNVLSKDVNYRIAHRIRRRIRNEIKGARAIKLISTNNLLGCSWDELMEHIKSQFYDKILPDNTVLKMSWDNYGYGREKWHLDHFRPCCSFDLSKIEEQYKCFNYKNLRPLWQDENCAKSFQDRKLSIKTLNKPVVV